MRVYVLGCYLTCQEQEIIGLFSSPEFAEQAKREFLREISSDMAPYCSFDVTDYEVDELVKDMPDSRA